MSGTQGELSCQLDACSCFVSFMYLSIRCRGTPLFMSSIKVYPPGGGGGGGGGRQRARSTFRSRLSMVGGLEGELLSLSEGGLLSRGDRFQRM